MIEGQQEIDLTAAARDARDEALQRVSQAADPEWKDLAYDAVIRTARLLQEFISDDVWETGGLDSTREDRALGPVFLRASRDGICRKTDRVRPSIRSHLSGKPVWQSLIHESRAWRKHR
jgi:hypothetical protein